MPTTSTSHRARLITLCLIINLVLLAAPGFSAPPQPQQTQREHLTPQEVELVRDNQELDKRTAVFIKAAERRLLSLTAPRQVAPAKQTKKESEAWGELPKGTRAELLSDLARILDEAITNIDDTATRSPDSLLLPKALKQLAEASTHFLAQLAPLRDSAAEGPEREALERTFDELQEIIEAAKRVPDVKGEK